ncbi:cellulase family glycosylhydrolase [Solimonas terrae]|uniref:Glycoside hydrolase family 5 protein n=1 Tax=Solimonas terrae TaxID=1396819 RepID=A0A6M2BR52_9GAMM|nr:cellulase family glycosylhydrolase [Solimonas terrae]NGY04800.1 glycoside hydrolase family 5 protein [Solimonas terrae]
MRAVHLFGASVLACALVGCKASTVPGEAQSGDEASAPLRRDGRWLVDAENRVVMLHGVNMVWKTAPFVPPATADGFVAADADWLADHGFNTARIGVLWAGVMPTQAGVIDQDYLVAWDRVIQLLARRHIWMLFDFHQDMLGPLYQGEGVPDWAVEQLPGSFTTLLGPPAFGFPFNYFTPQLSQAYDNLWADTGEIRDGFREAWTAVAKRWADQPYSMGYDLFNEPWAGLEYASCLVPLVGCPAHDSQELQPFYEYARNGIRSVDQQHIIWFESEPEGSSVGTPKGFTAVAGESQLGYSFHDYCPLAALTQSVQLGLIDALPIPATCNGFNEASANEARDQADRMNAVELLTEFGATDDLELLRQTTALADEHLIGWQYWHYKNWADPTTQSQGSGAQGLFTDDADLSTVKPDKLRILERSYPQATAGIPEELSFDPDSGAFHYRYTPRAAGGPTLIYIPLSTHYPNGYHVEVSGATVVSAPNAGQLRLDNLAGANEVTIDLTAN